ncbi:MAG: hypothetical protein AAGA66_06820 [Bacteroidota bacterium]
MEITGNRLMASSIEEVIENPGTQTIKFKIMFPVDFDNNVFEERSLEFNEVIFYSVDEIIIPIGRIPQINLITDLGQVKKLKAEGPRGEEKQVIRKRFEIQTTIGKRIIEFSDYKFSN